MAMASPCSMQVRAYFSSPSIAPAELSATASRRSKQQRGSSLIRALGGPSPARKESAKQGQESRVNLRNVGAADPINHDRMQQQSLSVQEKASATTASAVVSSTEAKTDKSTAADKEKMERVLPILSTALLAATTYSLFSKAPKPSTALKEEHRIPAWARKANSKALATIMEYYPDALEEHSFVNTVAGRLYPLGFTKDNCIAMVNTCRDEISRPLAALIDQEYGHSFNIAGLGALITCGPVGMGAGMSHSPQLKNDNEQSPRERYLFFAFPHVAIGETGEVGSIMRRGRGAPSSACGALIAIKKGIDAKAGPAKEDPDDVEFNLLRKKVLTKPACRTGASGPTLIDVTQAALEVIEEDLENLIAKAVDPSKADYAVITGIQIHSSSMEPGEEFTVDKLVDYVAPGMFYAVVQGKRYELSTR